MLKSSYTIYAMASEENENMIEVEVAKQVNIFKLIFFSINFNTRGSI
jgi:hypothetical protein